MKQIKIFIVDPSPVVRKILFRELSRHPDMVVMARADNLCLGINKIFRIKPDVLLLNLEAPNAVELESFYRLLEHCPIPTLVMSSSASHGGERVLEALENGAVDVVDRSEDPTGAGEMCLHLAEKVRSAAGARLHCAGARRSLLTRSAGAGRLMEALKRNHYKVIAIGGSTGGTQALRYVLGQLPPQSPGMVVVQHMPPRFTLDFARRLDRSCCVEVREARDGDPVMPGLALIAPGDRHILLKRAGIHYRVEIMDGPPVGNYRPSVDLLFQSVALCARAAAVGVLLTGMGRDGARGLLAMRRAGAPTIVQDEATSTVYGMPGEAVRLGAAELVMPLEKIPLAVVRKIVGEESFSTIANP